MPDIDWTPEWEEEFDESDLDDSDFGDEFAVDEEDHRYVTCRNCSANVYEDAEICPYCHEFLERGSTRFLDSKPSWYVLLALLGIVAVIVALLLF